MFAKKRVVHSFAAAIMMAVFTSFIVMCLYWLCSGMKYGMQKCVPVFSFTCVGLVVIFTVLNGVVKIRQWRMLNEIAQTRVCEGYTEKYYSQLSQYIAQSGMNRNVSLLTFACAQADGENYTQAVKTLDLIVLKQLQENERDSYFNTMLYCAVATENFQLSQNIYNDNKGVFLRAVKKKRWHIVHTEGMYFELTGDYEQAEKLYLSAEKHSSDKELSFECKKSLAQLYLKTGNREKAKEKTISASQYVYSIFEREQLRELMIMVEKAYT